MVDVKVANQYYLERSHTRWRCWPRLIVPSASKVAIFKL